MKKPELLIPASSLEVLRVAVSYGADAVYIGGEAFGLRAKAKNFTLQEMAQGIAFAHEHGVKVYVTANIFAHNGDLEDAYAYFGQLRDLKTRDGRNAAPDALIISDPGMFALAKRAWPEAEIHISTQANSTNYETWNFWWNLGAQRVVAARELSLQEIRRIRSQIPKEMEIECFVHGAMCISYSGRCLLSNYFTGRDANRGACTHPCRWKYAVVEETRPGEYLPVYENERGTFLFNSKDLCMIEEKYRQNMPWYLDEIARCTYRQFTTGFYFGRPDETTQIYDASTYYSDAVYLGIVYETDEKGRARIEQRNKFCVKDRIEIMKPDGRDVEALVERIEDEEGAEMDSAPHPKQVLWLTLSEEIQPGDLLRTKKGGKDTDDE